jgi:ABC-type sulfate transport system permease component
MKGIVLVAITVFVFPIVFGVIYGWPLFLKKCWDAMRHRQGKQAVQLPFQTLYVVALLFAVWTYAIGFLLVDDGNKAPGIIVILLGMPAWMFVIFGGIDKVLRFITKKANRDV